VSSQIALECVRELCANATTIITVSRSLAKIIAETYAIPLEHICVVHNGMDIELFQRTAKPARLTKLRQAIAPQGEQIILFAGRLVPQKGIHALFAAAERVVAEYPGVRYLIVGAPFTQEHETMLHELTQRYPNAERHMKRLGRVPRSQLAQLYQIADLALIPSIYEPFGYAAIEAMAAGVPVIASRVGGLAEIIDHGVTGWLVPVHTPPTGPHQVDVDELAAAQLHLLGDRPLAQRLARAAHTQVIERFTISKMAQATLQAYQHTLARSTPLRTAHTSLEPIHDHC
jgi:glycosyltransferase involved in cell wall biosynthesis